MHTQQYAHSITHIYPTICTPYNTHTVAHPTIHTPYDMHTLQHAHPTIHTLYNTIRTPYNTYALQHAHPTIYTSCNTRTLQHVHLALRTPYNRHTLQYACPTIYTYLAYEDMSWKSCSYLDTYLEFLILDPSRRSDPARVLLWLWGYRDERMWRLLSGAETLRQLFGKRSSYTSPDNVRRTDTTNLYKKNDEKNCIKASEICANPTFTIRINRCRLRLPIPKYFKINKKKYTQ